MRVIYIDSRVGSNDLLPYFATGTAQLTTLVYADLCFQGNGPDSLPWCIGIERKRISDLINSMCSGRLSGHQLPGLRNTYNEVYLVVEGIWRPSPRDGSIEIPARGKWLTLKLGARHFTASMVYGYLNTLMVIGHIHVFMTASARETAAYVQSLHSWWNNKEWDEHKALEHEYSPTVQIFTKKAPFLRRVACELPGVGTDKAKAIERHFRDLEQMIGADVKEFMKVPGIGKKIAEGIYKTIHGREE